jgi:hypothetical protein
MKISAKHSIYWIFYIVRRELAGIEPMLFSLMPGQIADVVRALILYLSTKGIVPYSYKCHNVNIHLEAKGAVK